MDFSEVLSDRARQVAVGWMRNAFEQSRVLAELRMAGLGHAGAPNRRSYIETLVRIQWLDGVPHAERADAVDAMLAEDKSQAAKEVTHLRDMGYEGETNLDDMGDVVLEVTENRHLAEQARVFVHAAKATQNPSVGLYRAWRYESQFAHATAVLGGAYAPDRGGRIGAGRPGEADPELESHVMSTMLVMVLTARLLQDEGLPKGKVNELVAAYFG